MEEIKNEKLRRKRRIIIAAAGTVALLATVLIVVLVAVPAFTGEDGAAKPGAIEPLLYTKDGSAYMASGGRAVQLEGANIVQSGSDYSSLNATFCEDNEWLFYIANCDNATGEGDLMRVAADGQSMPVLVASGVCDAKVTGGGQRVLYTCGTSADSLFALDMAWDKPRLIAEGVSWYTLSANGRRALYICGNENTGDLYSWDFVGEPEFIAGGVCSEYDGFLSGHSFDENCGFSPDAKNIYYVVKTTESASGRYAYTLYVKIGARQAEKVSKRSENSFFSGTMNGGGPLGNNGQMLYFSRGEGSRPLYVFYPGGDTEHFTGACTVYAVFDDGSFLLTSDSSLYYKAPEQEEQRLSKHLYYFPLFGRTYYDLRPNAEKRFLLIEDYTGFSGGIPDKVTVFEQKIGNEKTEIFEMDGRLTNLTFDPDLTKAAYKQDGALYFIQKENNKWSRPVKVSDTGFAEIIFYVNIFDTTGEHMYYRQLENEDAKGGGLYRYIIKRRKSELLMQDVQEFYLIEDIPYAITAENALFRADTGDKLAQGVDSIWQAEGGIHIFTGTRILYYGKETDKPVTLCEGAETISDGGITYLPPLTDEVAAALEELCADAQRCIDILEAGGTGSFEEYQEKAAVLKARRDVSAEIDGILGEFSTAFMMAGMWDAYAKTDIEGGKEASESMRGLAIKDLSDAITACREYLVAEGDI